MTQDDKGELGEILEEVRRIEVQSRRLVMDLISGGYSSVFRGTGIEFDEVREYVDGDDPAAIDWNVTARTGRPYIKKYVEEREQTILFLLDLSASMSGAFGPWSSRQMAARVCGCLAFTAVNNNDKVGLIAFSEGVDGVVPPQKGSGHVLRIIRDCLALHGSSPRTSLHAALEMTARVLHRRSVVILVSDFMASGWADDLTRCARRHDVVAVRLHPSELAEPGDALVRLQDPETGRAVIVDWSDPVTRDAYRARVEAWRDRTALALRRAGVDVMEVPVPRRREKDSVAGPILKFFHQRSRRR